MRRVSLLALTLVVFAGPAAADRGRPITHHDLDVRLDPASAQLDVRARVHFAEASDATAPLHFVLNGALEIREASIDGRPVDVSTRSRWRPRDFFARPDYGALASFARVKQHTIAAPEGGWPADTVVELHYAGAVYDSLQAPKVAYARGFETTSGLIDPRGAFLTSETFWVPWTRDERFTFRLRTALDGWHSMSQGTRVEHSVDGEGRNVSVWEESHPQELVYLIAGPYTIRERTHGDVALYTYTYANTDDELANTYLDGAGRYLDLYGEMFGPYPFDKWAMVENWWQTGFGMPSFTLLGDRVIRLPFIVHTSYGHEILHCWWGNGVYVDYDQGNWCEGLTAYGADYLYKTWESEAAARDHRRNQLVGYLDFASTGDRDFPLRDFRERSDFGTAAIGYGKTMMVFHMLKRLVGEEAFGESLQHFYANNTFRPANWGDVEASFEEVGGRDLTAWFAQWVQRPGAPKLRIAEVTASPTPTVRLVQEEPVFDLEVPVRIQTADGPVEKTVAMDAAEVVFELPAGARDVAIDPDWHLFRLLYREEIPPTLSQGLGAERTVVVIGADAPADVAKALRAMAETWAENQDMQIVDETDFDATADPERSLFLLGEGELARRALAAATAFGDEPARLVDESRRTTDSLVYVVRDPADAERAWTVVLPESADVCDALGRKLPHYSKYSWLRFDGEENVGKGNWTVVDSPLRRVIGAEAGR